MDFLTKLGVHKKSKPNFARTLFYFLRECHINPLDEEYIVEYEGKKIRIIKKGLAIPLFNALLEEMQEHYKREEAEMKKGRRR